LITRKASIPGVDIPDRGEDDKVMMMFMAVIAIIVMT
jgi:hypothetical protein